MKELVNNEYLININIRYVDKDITASIDFSEKSIDAMLGKSFDKCRIRIYGNDSSSTHNILTHLPKETSLSSLKKLSVWHPYSALT